MKDDDINQHIEEKLSDDQIQEILEKVDPESVMRKWNGKPKVALRWLSVAFSIFMIAILTQWRFPIQVHRSFFVGIVLLLVFLLYPISKNKNSRTNFMPWYDILFALLGAGSFFYYAINFENIARAQMTFTTTDLVVAVIGIAVILIATYRVVGLSFLIVVLTFLSYTWWGRFIPGQFGHGGFRFERVFTFLFYTTEGVIGTPIGVASTFIFAFLLFGSIMVQTGIGQFFIDIANALTGKSIGGPAKMAVLVSALTGMVSGSSIANTVSSGAYTIPMMKRMGYGKDFSGAVEASASTGGQIVPPILGAAAFLMSEITGIPYQQIALAAVIPAVLYYVCIFAAIHFEAKKKNLRGLPKEELQKALPLFLQKGQLLIGIISIIVFMNWFTPTMSAFYAVLVSIGVSLFRKDTRITPTKIIDALETTAKNTIGVAVACAAAGIIIGVVLLSGLGLAFVSSMIALANIIAHDAIRLLVVLIFCMIASLILGLGMPTTAKYVIMATVTAPILVMLDVPLLAAHFFVFYFAVDADITPPVGLAAYAAAGIAKGDPLKTSIIAVRLGVAAYVIPFFFVFNPQMLFIDATAIDIITLAITSTVGIVCVAAGLSGFFVRYMYKYERILFVLGGLVLVHPSFITDIIGIAILSITFIIHKSTQKENTATTKA